MSVLLAPALIVVLTGRENSTNDGKVGVEIRDIDVCRRRCVDVYRRRWLRVEKNDLADHERN
jgi:hypothetical protein